MRYVLMFVITLLNILVSCNIFIRLPKNVLHVQLELNWSSKYNTFIKYDYLVSKYYYFKKITYLINNLQICII